MGLPPVEDSSCVDVTVARTLLDELNDYISVDGLWWTGFYERHLWGEGNAAFEYLFRFLSGKKGVLAETLRSKLTNEESEELFSNAAAFAFHPFTDFLESFFDDESFEEFFLRRTGGGRRNRNLLRAWTSVAENCTGDSVGHAWDYFKGRLRTRERWREFLLKRDRSNWNALCGACCNRMHPYTSLYVWELFGREFPSGPCKEMFRDALDEVIGSYKVCSGASLTLAFELLKCKVVDEDEMTRLLQRKDKRGRQHLLQFDSNLPLPPPVFSTLQCFVLRWRLTVDSAGESVDRDVLNSMEGHYEALSSSCVRFSSWIGVDAGFEERVEVEFETMRHSLLEFPLLRRLPSQEQGTLPLVKEWRAKGEMVGVKEIQLKAFVVLLRRQIWLEESVLGLTEVVMRLRSGWYWMFDSFPSLITDGHKERTKELLVLLTFSVLSQSMKRKNIGRILMKGDFYEGTVFNSALDKQDYRAFLALYDVARWSMAEGALAKVHAIGKRGFDVKTVLQLLLERQDKGGFENV